MNELLRTNEFLCIDPFQSINILASNFLIISLKSIEIIGKMKTEYMKLKLMKVNNFCEVPKVGVMSITFFELCLSN